MGQVPSRNVSIYNDRERSSVNKSQLKYITKDLVPAMAISGLLLYGTRINHVNSKNKK